MVGSRTNPTRQCGRFAAIVALSLATGASAHATDPAPAVPDATSGSPDQPEPGAVPVETSLLATIADSLLGDAYAPGRWRPLSFRGFFSDGWLEPWGSGPNGRKGLTPRHGWLGAFDGVFFRLWVTEFDDTNHLTTPFGGNQYAGTYSIFLPLSRRFEVLVATPFVVANRAGAPTRGERAQFGDFTVTPRFLLAESVATSHVFAMDVRTPTGTTATDNGVMALAPRYAFWTNPGGAWVVRGAAGCFVPLNRSETPAQTALTGGLAVGRYFTPHDMPLGDLVFYCACNYSVPLDGGAARETLVSLGPGTRFHLTHNYFFLNFWDFPVTGNRPDTFSVQFALLKVF
jgi:hypothetical protein